jgi:asparagine synthase (glutamine-hydrolysing)
MCGTLVGTLAMREAPRMCGIAGLSDPTTTVASPLDPRLERMLRVLKARGPDGEGVARLAGAQIGMRRLAITDPVGGAQPVWNEDRSLALVMNGEVYNHRQLRVELLRRGHAFRTASDAEVVVHLYEERATDAFVALSGMYALALWDGRRGEIVLARDPVGQRPLLVRALADFTLFASDLRALVAALPGVGRPAIDPAGLDSYLAYRAVVGRPTLLRGIERVLPGEVVRIREGAVMARFMPSPPSRPLVVPDADPAAVRRYTDRLDATLAASVRRVADTEVSTGILLSGGVDSALVLALAQERAHGMPAFVAEWQGLSGVPSEWPRASRLARAFGARPERVPVRPEALAQGLGALAAVLDEPLADPTALPLWTTVRAASGEVKVLLTGEGADELFAGYEGYREPLVTAPLAGIARLPAAQRLGAWARGRGLPGGGLLERARVPVGLRYLGPGATFAADERRRLYAPGWPAGGEAEAAARSAAAAYPETAWLAAMRAVDRAVWLSDEALMKLDRIAMGHAVEARTPYLEPDVVALADALPANVLVSAHETKRILRAVARRHLPASYASAPKRGFPVPLTRLLDGPWQDLARSTVLSKRSALCALFEPAALSAVFEPAARRTAGTRARQRFALLMLELWLEAVLAAPARVPLSVAEATPLRLHASSPRPARDLRLAEAEAETHTDDAGGVTHAAGREGA